jgi:hypothetical protein
MADVPPPPAKPTLLAVLGSDYLKTSVSLVDIAKNTVAADVLTSDTVLAAGQAALSGDVVLASHNGGTGTVLLVDRAKGAITWLGADGKVQKQALVENFAKSNPQDAVWASPGRLYVARLGVNPTPTAVANDFDEGDDLVVLDPATGKLTEQLKLSSYATAPGTNAAPQRMATDGTLVWLPLGSLSADFQKVGTGRVLGVDALTGQVVKTVDLPASKNCAKAVYLPTTQQVAVVCSGAYPDGADQAKFSNVVVFDAQAAQPTAKVAAAALGIGGSKRALGADLTAVDGTHVVVTVYGDFATEAGEAWLLDLTTAKAVSLFKATDLYASSLDGWVAPDGLTGWFADGAHKPGDLRVFDFATLSAPVAKPAVQSHPKGPGAVEVGAF